MLARLAAACLLAVATPSCWFFVTTGPGTNAVFILTTGCWHFQPDRVWSGVPGSATYPIYPTDPLREEDYHPGAPPGSKYSIVVSGEGRWVSIDGSPPIKGTRTDHSEQHVTYSLGEGLPAGGRLIVWREGSGYQAELTRYGSGVPVAKSERGTVVRTDGQ